MKEPATNICIEARCAFWCCVENECAVHAIASAIREVGST